MGSRGCTASRLTVALPSRQVPSAGRVAIVERVPNRSRKIDGVQVNFIAKFDIDEGETTDLAHEAKEYDTSPSAEYEAWMLLEPTDRRRMRPERPACVVTCQSLVT